MKRRNMVTQLIILIAIVIMIVGSRRTKFCKDFGMIVHKDESMNYLVIVHSGRIDKEFHDKKLYESVNIYDEIEVILLKKKIFCFVYKTEMELTEKTRGS